MWEIISGIIVVMFALIGIVESTRTIIFRLYKPKTETSALIIVTEEENCEDIEYTLRSWIARAKWMGKAMPDTIIFLDQGLSKDSRDICANICKEYEFLEIMNTDELYNKLTKKNT